MKPKKLTNAQFLKKVESLQKDKGFTYLDSTGKEWTGEMARVKYFGMTRAEYRAKLKEAKNDISTKEPVKKSEGRSKPKETKAAAAAKKSVKRANPSAKTEDNSTTLPVKMKWIKTENYAKDGRYYMELPDGLRLIFGPNGYEGYYNPNLSESV